MISDNVMIANVNELASTNNSKFGKYLKKARPKTSAKVEVCNENGGRKIISFNGMLPGDAYMWSKYWMTDMAKFKEFTEKKFDKQRGYRR
jgi:hypothetical protein